ncbi:hypothetical protein FQR65_LT07369 [Abscondita terminalis]|nr:hypothetical protein FQR65_LT07369 [Abscondita terminalis]
MWQVQKNFTLKRRQVLWGGIIQKNVTKFKKGIKQKKPFIASTSAGGTQTSKLNFHHMWSSHLRYLMRKLSMRRLYCMIDIASNI